MKASSNRALRIAVDTGGTFTDCVWFEQGELKTLKVFSTPDDPSRAIAEALRRIGARPGFTLLHGTTVGTNALLQRKGARVALVTTSGFEDVIEIGRQARPRLYDFFFDRVSPLVARDMRFGIRERVDNQGRILERPSQDELSSLRKSLLQARPESIAISFLFSFANPENESRVAATLASLEIPLSVSHQILPEFREYERTSTVVVNAYLQPLMQSYMEKLAERVGIESVRAGSVKTGSVRTGLGPVQAGHSPAATQPRSRIFVMQSSGGITALESAANEPVRTVLSGPAGGLVGAAVSASRSGFANILSFDMGGTSTDVAVVQGKISTNAQSEVAGLPVGVPMLDIHTVGAGGGSLARFDAAGLLHVGPESAGAHPGPICYGRGSQPTVTDVNLLLGRLRPNRFLGGEFTLDLERTRRLVAAWLKQQRSRLSLHQFARGVIRVVNANMERALRVVSIERGYDPRDFALVAFGGAGGLHACELADALAIPTVIIPARPGALSAFGILVSDVVKDFSRTLLWRLQSDSEQGARVARTLLSAQARPSSISHTRDSAEEEEFRKLEAEARKSFAAEGWQAGNAIKFERSLDLRYRGQGYELNVPAGAHAIARFHQEHERRYGYNHPGREVELVTVRLRATLPMPDPCGAGAPARVSQRPSVTARSNARSKPIEQAKVVFEKPEITPVYERASLPPNRILKGPAVITEYSATTVIPPRKTFLLDFEGNLVINLRGE